MKEPTKLKKILEERGIKQKYLAEKSGMHKRKISAIVNDKAKLKAADAVLFADILKVSLEEIV